jgi:hypothetical protein
MFWLVTQVGVSDRSGRHAAVGGVEEQHARDHEPLRLVFNQRPAERRGRRGEFSSLFAVTE